jgi:hypothetical protein
VQSPSSQSSWSLSLGSGKSGRGVVGRSLRQAGRLTKIALLTTLLIGCSMPRAGMDNSRRLMQRNDFEQAVRAAPEWVRDALKTINQLEHEIESQ